MSDDIPLIDLAPLRDGLDGARQIASALNHALENVGFLIIVNHGVPADLIAALGKQEPPIDERTVDVWIGRLRRALRLDRRTRRSPRSGRRERGRGRRPPRRARRGARRIVSGASSSDSCEQRGVNGEGRF